MEKGSQVIFEKSVSEFVIVAAEVCRCFERAGSMKRKEFIDQSLKLLPLLYLKATLLPKCEAMEEDDLETYVTEELYEEVRSNLARVMGEKDDYLEVFLPDMAYSDQPIRKCISEELADIYQDIRDFIFIFGLGLNQTMHDSLARCIENFGPIWGQKLVNTLRAIHDVKYNIDPDDETFEDEDLPYDDSEEELDEADAAFEMRELEEEEKFDEEED
ncbi:MULTISPECIES: DUF5063 domain-containing protein [Bacteroides]|uniref:DUF5063 domain-containing protein n=1 Tax=Bacteroides TaxID=816 RepID=UPI0004AE5D4D|nr:DUF5063 domain-containing protein [Bacteroides neonati]MCP3894823.1 DUF5063 domain-containing protein [Bacteroides sp.]